MKKKIKSYSRNLLILAIVLLSSQTANAQFTPGAGGSLSSFTPFTEIPNKVSGFFVERSQREINPIGNIVYLSFPYPSTIEADTYTLQFSTDDGSTWNNYQYNGADLTSSNNNLRLSFEAEYKLRLLVNGGPKNLYTSNEVDAPLSFINTYFQSWGLDESMNLTGIMMPWVGRGLEATFTVKKLEDNSIVSGYLTYQWYRVNPATFEMTEIPGATALTYTTTEQDAGYNLVIKANGDGINVGGFIQIFSMDKTAIQNKGFASNITSNGFTLNLYKSTSSLSVDDLTLTDANFDTITITSVIQGENAAIYNIEATLDVNMSYYTLENNSDFWRLVTEFEEGMIMPFVYFEFGPSVESNVSIEDQTFGSSSTECFGATETIVVAENGNQVLFKNESITNLIAGQSILFMPGTIIESGAYLHAKISTTGEFCDAIASQSIVSNSNVNIKGLELELFDKGSDSIIEVPSLKVFPNPNDGHFTLQALNFESESTVQIINSTGLVVFKQNISEEKTSFELNNLPRGFYFVRTINDKINLTQRIIIK